MRERVVWLTGPMGVGKSTTGWLAQRACPGTSVFVDGDQVGLCNPAPEDDPWNHRVKARNLGALAFDAHTWFLAAGIDSDRVWARYRSAVPATEVVVCRLRADEAELRARIAGRGGPLARFADRAVAEARDLDAVTFPDVVVDTTGRTAEASVELVLRTAAR